MKNLKAEPESELETESELEIEPKCKNSLNEIVNEEKKYK